MFDPFGTIFSTFPNGVEKTVFTDDKRIIYWGTESSETISVQGKDAYDIAVHGRGGDDKIIGSDSEEHIWGDEGDDYINGFGGIDILNGGRGNDTLTGGKGVDYFSLSAGFDVITDFSYDRAEGRDLVIINTPTAINGISIMYDGSSTFLSCILRVGGASITRFQNADPNEVSNSLLHEGGFDINAIGFTLDPSLT